ncbi:hypothetical protein [Pseudoalteromonas luteoviolacea]|uniref:Uncharacterized protein n=1 Tax=Pseudoalteromonas luteoviolacea S4054 TaxID=1129367 RepID=A0A0F6AI52_9GAMM|nr:hypothetical protein [Pseudoalteromonas luteoviolacea]AOT07874.1 hypothetical protein S4054249_08485 [Pseudoalteromonas luteoviolacea]AOT12790.1 hypothetical protein S40542_08485 [Pseudoalteromonas luteoviolacea]AOT17703.1 hypothetical protein S4054_08480 [Pseudoalteromonas luteoviolacea]KKE85887.1 hypothetical protein N479_00505 [Pseudoalteromonas luteoviolacea S4054]KZN74765.1 hypothetical protein N481_08885 [Pseudoalteromonas luteoviolacea S4047-1]
MNKRQLDVVASVKKMTSAFHQGNLEKLKLRRLFNQTNGCSAIKLSLCFKEALAIRPVITYPNKHQVIIAGNLAIHTAYRVMKPRFLQEKSYKSVDHLALLNEHKVLCTMAM